MNGEKEYTNDIRAICVIIIFFLNLFVRRKIYKNKKHKKGLHIQFIAYGLIKVLKYVVMWRLELHLFSVAMTTGVLACERALGGGMA